MKEVKKESMLIFVGGESGKNSNVKTESRSFLECGWRTGKS